MRSIVHGADIQDRDGGVMLMAAIFGLFPSLLKLYADIGYTGPKFQAGLSEVCGQVNVEIVKRTDAIPAYGHTRRQRPAYRRAGRVKLRCRQLRPVY